MIAYIDRLESVFVSFVAVLAVFISITIITFWGRRSRRAKRLQGRLDQIHHAIAVRGRDRVRHAQTELIKLRDSRAMRHAFRFIDT